MNAAAELAGILLVRVALLAGLGFAGCGGTSVPRPMYPFASPAAALLAQRSASERVRSIRAEARVDQRGHDGRIRGTVLMFVERPDRVRFDVMTQFGPVAILTSDGERFAYADLREGRFLTGETCPQNIARLLNVPLTVEQTTILLLGGTPVIAHDQARVSWNDAGFYRVVLGVQDGSRQEIDLSIDARDRRASPANQRLALHRSEIYDPRGKSRWRATYQEFRDLALGTERVAMPFEVRVEQPQLNRDTLIKFKQIKLNAEVAAEAFAQSPGPGQTEEVASCDEQR
jgi:outer membrane lipoprotein-sorting protein